MNEERAAGLPSEDSDVAGFVVGHLESGSFTEDKTPGTGSVVTTTQPTHEDRVRQVIAGVMLLVLVAIVGVGGAGWLLWGGDQNRMQTFALIFGPVLTLIGTMFGFYFSKK